VTAPPCTLNGPKAGFERGVAKDAGWFYLRRRSFLDHLRGSALAMAFITTWRMKPRQDLFAPLLPPSALCFDTARNKLFGDIFTRFKVLEKKDKEEAR